MKKATKKKLLKVTYIVFIFLCVMGIVSRLHIDWYHDYYNNISCQLAVNRKGEKFYFCDNGSVYPY